MNSRSLIIAEMRAAELVEALQAAVSHEPHWRTKAAKLLLSIERGELPIDAQPGPEWTKGCEQ